MIRRSLEAIPSRLPDGAIVLTSPALGVYGNPPRLGEGLVAGSVAGTLVILGRTVDLLVPEGGAGTVAEVHVHDRKTPVAFAQPLVTLSRPAVPLSGEAKPAARGARGARAKSSSARGSTGLDSPADLPGASSSSMHRSRSAPAGPASSVGSMPAGGPRTRAASGARLQQQSGGDEALPPGAFALRAPTTGVFYARPDPDSEPFVSEGATLESGQTAGLIEVMKCFSPIVHPGGALLPSPAIVESIHVLEGEEVRPGQILFVLRRP